MARQGPARDEQPRKPAGDREQHRFSQQLRDDVPATGANRKTYCHLRRARGRTSQQQVRDVRAADQQHDDR